MLAYNVERLQRTVARSVMHKAYFGYLLAFLFIVGLVGYGCGTTKNAQYQDSTYSFIGLRAGDERQVAGIKLCWCPPGRFLMGSPPGEPERRSDEDQVEVTLTKGYWTGKYEVTQGQWKRVIGKLPGELTEEGGEGGNIPVYNVNYGEAEAFCLKLTELGHTSGDLPLDWEFRLPTEAQCMKIYLFLFE
jgi:formylglycine-generating enzyme required for sulfatase activity